MVIFFVAEKSPQSAKEETVPTRKFFLPFCLWVLIFGLSGLSAAEDQSCSYCGMYKSKFEHSWVIIEHEDNTLVSVCSIHCAAIDMALHTDKNIRKISVGDYDQRKPIDAETAYWVIGGDIMGVMTSRAKWAFETKDGADNFIKKHGGRIANFREVIKAAFEDMYQDTLMIRRKRNLINLRKNQSQ
jgi:nitrous oxide reductase accessory protein NosL